MFQPPDLCLIQRGQVGVFLFHGHAPGFQRRMERIQPSCIVLLLVHRPADLLRRQSMPPGTGRQQPGQFLCL